MEERKTVPKEKPKGPVIRVKGLYKVYRVGETKVYALNGVDFEVERGQFVAIVGASGSGKSTLLNMLAGLEKPTKGQIEVAGRHIEKLTERQLVAFRREKVGFIFQSYNLLNTMNAVENVALPLAFRGIPKKQRLTIARALVGKPKILILDDSSSALDYATDAALRKSIGALSGQMTVFIVSQRASSILHADKILVLDDGKVVGAGTSEELLQSCEVYREIYETQFQKEAVNG